MQISIITIKFTIVGNQILFSLSGLWANNVNIYLYLNPVFYLIPTVQYVRCVAQFYTGHIRFDCLRLRCVNHKYY